MTIKDILRKLRLWPKAKVVDSPVAESVKGAELPEQSDSAVGAEGQAATGVVDGEAGEKAAECQVVPHKSLNPLKRREEVLNEAFGKLIGELQGINENLNSQSEKHQELLHKMEDLPEILKSFPESTKSQRELIETVAEEMKRRELKEEQFLEAVESIPAESGKQTEILSEMGTKLSAAAECDIQLTENFKRFNKILARLNENAVNQTNGILQMNNTFRASDAYVRDVISKQSTRFMWMYIISIVVCLTAIAGLTIGIFLLLGK